MDRQQYDVPVPVRPADDAWKHRSAKMRCRTCIWFVIKERQTLAPESAFGNLGRCRFNAPTVKGFVPVYEEDWCGQHRLDENKA